MAWIVHCRALGLKKGNNEWGFFAPEVLSSPAVKRGRSPMDINKSEHGEGAVSGTLVVSHTNGFLQMTVIKPSAGAPASDGGDAQLERRGRRKARPRVGWISENFFSDGTFTFTVELGRDGQVGYFAGRGDAQKKTFHKKRQTNGFAQGMWTVVSAFVVPKRPPIH